MKKYILLVARRSYQFPNSNKMAFTVGHAYRINSNSENYVWVRSETGEELRFTMDQVKQYFDEQRHIEKEI